MSSRTDDNKLSLGIQDKYIKNIKSVAPEFEYRGVKYTLFSADLTRKCNICKYCGHKKLNKIGFTVSKVRDCAKNPFILLLKKQRYKCKNCGQTFVPENSYAKPYARYSEDVNTSIYLKLEKKISQKVISELEFTSESHVSKVSKNISNIKKSVTSYLPECICIDEFKGIKSSKHKMHFIFSDGNTNEVINIFESRKGYYLEKEFNMYTAEARSNVKLIVMDMFKPYIPTMKKIFKNATFVIDRFHIVKLVSDAFNLTRINVMKLFDQKSLEYKRLKRYWKLFLKNYSDLDSINFRNFVHFVNGYKSETTVVEESLKLSEELMNSYIAYQYILDAIKKKDFIKFKHILDEYYNVVSDIMRKKFNTLYEFLQYIENSFKYTYSNGPLEGINNTIKLINRIAYGYRTFEALRARILHILKTSYYVLSNSKVIT